MVANLFLSDDTSTISILEPEETETNTLTTSMHDSSQTSATTIISTSHAESSTILTKTIVSNDETISYTETKTQSELIEITIQGNVIKGVEAGCVLIDTGDEKYLMLRGTGIETLEIGEWVTVKGYELDEISTCMEGLPFEISHIPSDSDNDPDSSDSSSSISSTSKTESYPTEITIQGEVVQGVEAGCVLIDTGDEKYLMLRGTGIETLEIGEWVTVKGYELDEISTCMEGLPFEISHIPSDSDNDPDSSDSSSEIDSNQNTISMANRNKLSHNPSVSWSSLPDCSDDTLFTVPFMKIEDIWYIQPLGTLGPPSHTVPVDHLYVHTQDGQPPPLTNIYAPGNIRVMSITYGDFWIDGIFQIRDYGLKFASCNTEKVSLAHLTTVIPEIFDTMNNIEPDLCVSYDIIEVKWMESFKLCSYSISVDIPVGTKIATVGGPMLANIMKPVSGGLDVTGVDAKASPSEYVNPDRVNYYTDIVCPLNFFTEDVRKAQEAKFGGLEVGQLIRRTVEPVCGTHVHDIYGTAQGLWWIENYPYSESDNRYALTLAIDNAYPLVSAIAPGGQFIDPDGWYFDAKNYGLINRAFEDVTPDGNIYCYENLRDRPNISYYSSDLLKGIILIQMIDDLRLSIEYQEDSACEYNPQFIDSYIYIR